MLDRFHIRLGWNISRLRFFFIGWGPVFPFRLRSRTAEPAMHTVEGGGFAAERALVADAAPGKTPVQGVGRDLFYKPAGLILDQVTVPIPGIGIGDP